MWRLPAIESLLVERVASVPWDPESETAQEALATGRRKATVITLLNLAGLVGLILLWEAGTPILQLGGGEATLVTLALLAVAVYAGFRWGQREKYLAVSLALEELGAGPTEEEP